MPIFICDICKCAENTALGSFWTRSSERSYWKDPNLKGKALCSECTPTEYIDGSKNEDGGKWHGRFEKRFPTPGQVREALKKYNKAYIYISDLLPEEFPDGQVW